MGPGALLDTAAVAALLPLRTLRLPATLLRRSLRSLPRRPSAVTQCHVITADDSDCGTPGLPCGAHSLDDATLALVFALLGRREHVLEASRVCWRWRRVAVDGVRSGAIPVSPEPRPRDEFEGPGRSLVVVFWAFLAALALLATADAARLTLWLAYANMGVFAVRRLLGPLAAWSLSAPGLAQEAAVLWCTSASPHDARAALVVALEALLMLASPFPFKLRFARLLAEGALATAATVFLARRPEGSLLRWALLGLACFKTGCNAGRLSRCVATCPRGAGRRVASVVVSSLLMSALVSRTLVAASVPLAGPRGACLLALGSYVFAVWAVSPPLLRQAIDKC
eukprot:m51a1_g1510 hypothetical protein (340) ;mRNA; r:401586-402689